MKTKTIKPKSKTNEPYQEQLTTIAKAHNYSESEVIKDLVYNHFIDLVLSGVIHV